MLKDSRKNVKMLVETMSSAVESHDPHENEIIALAARIISALTLPAVSKKESQIASDERTAKSSLELLTGSAKLYLQLGNEIDLKISKTNTVEIREEIREAIEFALVSVLNMIDFEDPSWPTVRKDHLNSGVEVLASRRYILRGYSTFGLEPAPDLDRFPTLP